MILIIRKVCKGGSKIHRPTPGAAGWGGQRVFGWKKMTGQTLFRAKEMDSLQKKNDGARTFLE